MTRLDKGFFERETREVAQELIGCTLVRKVNGTTTAVVRITETEAYRGSDDPASHAHRSVTPRNQIMFGPAGRLYVYFTYGKHHCVNIVTETEGTPGAVLLRAARPIEGLEWIRTNRGGVHDTRLMDGPGKLAQALALDLSWNGWNLMDPSQDQLYLDYGEHLPYRATPRIGISKGQDLLWRYVAE